MSKIIVIGSQKGDVGKTMTTYGVEKTDELEYTIGHMLMAQIEDEKALPVKRCIRAKDGVDFIPASIYLSAVDVKLRTEMGAERMLDEVLEPLRGQYEGYFVYDWNGNVVYAPSKSSEPEQAKASYRVRVSIKNLSIRKGPGTNYDKIGKYTGIGVFTIVAEADGEGATKWGKLKSGAGWIGLDYAKRI